MILRELFYFNNDKDTMTKDDRYDSSRDDSVIKKKDTRKIALTLKQINRLRKAGDLHEIETQKDNEFFSKMYAAPPPAPAG
jgi:hypothetical protein